MPKLQYGHSGGPSSVMRGRPRKRRTEAHRGRTARRLRAQAPIWAPRGEASQATSPPAPWPQTSGFHPAERAVSASPSAVRRHDGPRGRTHPDASAPPGVFPSALSLLRNGSTPGTRAASTACGAQLTPSRTEAQETSGEWTLCVNGV